MIFATGADPVTVTDDRIRPDWRPVGTKYRHIGLQYINRYQVKYDSLMKFIEAQLKNITINTSDHRIASKERIKGGIVPTLRPPQAP